MKKGYDNETITAYLLGVLPEDETELFDEWSFTDDEFAGQMSAAEKDLVDRYIGGELRGTTLEQFKSYYLVSPLRLEKVEFARSFQEYLSKNTVVHAAVVESKPKQSFTTWFLHIFASVRSVRQWSFALAALALLFFGGWLLLENSRLRSDISQLQTNRDALQQREIALQERETKLQNEIAAQQTENSAAETELAAVRDEREKLQNSRKQIIQQKKVNEQQQTALQTQQTTPPLAQNRQPLVATFLLTPPLRGKAPLQTVTIPPKTAIIKMRLQLEADEYPLYRVILRDQSTGKTIFTSSQIKAAKNGANKILNVIFPAKLLKSPLYDLEVSGIASGGAAEIISDYSFKVMP